MGVGVGGGVGVVKARRGFEKAKMIVVVVRITTLFLFILEGERRH